MTEEFKVEKRPHPFGEAGVRSSLEQVAKKASEGAVDPYVKAWTTELLDQARKRGFSPTSDRARAEIILQACQQKLWVPDPVFAEYIPAARLLACNEHGDNGGVCLRGDDCDGLATLCGAALMSIGLPVMIVGHAYTQEKIIQHVLCAARIDGRWYYADPSKQDKNPAYPLGQCMPFSRERLLSAPNVRAICDKDVCLTDPRQFSPAKENFVSSGEFVGLSGVTEINPEDVEFSWRVRWLGEQEVVVPAEGVVRVKRADGEDVLVRSEPTQKKGWDTTEKFMFAGLVLSVIGLALDISKMRK